MPNSQHHFHLNKLSNEHNKHTMIFMSFHLYLIYLYLKMEFQDITPLWPEGHW